MSVARVSVHVSVRVWSSSIREEGHDLVDGLLMGREIVPEHGGIFEVCLGVALLGVDEEGEIGRVTDKEDGRVVVDPIPIAFLCVEFDGEAAGITGGIGRALFSTNSREACDAVGFLANSIKHVDGGDVGDVVSDFKDTISTSTLGMDDTLGDTLAWTDTGS